MLEKQNKKLIGSRIKEMRLEKGMTLEEFGRLFNASKSSVYGWEKGRHLPNKERLKHIAKIGGITLSVLLKGDTAPIPFIFPDFRGLNSNEELKKYSLHCVDLVRDGTPDVRAEDMYMCFFVSVSVLIEKVLRSENLDFSLLIKEIPRETFTELSKNEWVALDMFIVHFFEIENYKAIYYDITLNDLKLLREILLKYVELSGKEGCNTTLPVSFVGDHL